MADTNNEQPTVESERITRRSRLLDPTPVDLDGLDIGDPEPPARAEGGGTPPPRKEGPSPEEAVAEANRLAAAKDAELNEERRRRIEAERLAGVRGRDVVDAVTARMGEREASINSAIEAHKQKKENAARAMRMAMEANDHDAQIKASEDHADAVATLANLRVEKSNFDDNKARFVEESKRVNTAPTQTGGDTYTPAAQSWIASHPKFDSDKAYKAKAMGAHYEAVSLGILVDSPEYFQHLNGAVAALDGKAPPPPPARKPNAASTAAPPAREGGAIMDGGSGGSETVKFRDGSSLSLTRDNNGKTSVQGRIPGDWVEAAVWSGVAKSKSDRDGIIEYAVEQLKIMSATQRGEDTGLRMGGSALLQ